MKRALLLAEWSRAGSALRAAYVLGRERCFPDAVSRSYYSVFHAAKAALYVLDIVAETHQGVRRMFALHLVKSGAIEPEWSDHLGGTLDDRLAADYNAEVVVTADDARRAYRQAREFRGRIRAYLLNNGLTRAELRTRRKKEG